MLMTKRLILRGPKQTDLEDLFALFHDARAMKYWSTLPHPDKSVTQERLDLMIQGFADRPLYFVIEKDNRVIGCVGAHHGNEVGFILHPDHWRQGIASEAMNCLIPHIWQTTDFADIFADLDPNNAGSLALLTSLGFQKTGYEKNTFCIAGNWSDSLYMTLKRPQ
ncbi:GNAT family N-acetyltransferase [Aestuariibius sp. HNIBRBA575]|uniref:GNAT family N-acetyltransferase n=1 Tax=Aestuariibius sp. HNIBRBA575 TaxID=3233343 RepID=UPI0034A5BC2D